MASPEINLAIHDIVRIVGHAKDALALEDWLPAKRALTNAQIHIGRLLHQIEVNLSRRDGDQRGGKGKD